MQKTGFLSNSRTRQLLAGALAAALAVCSVPAVLAEEPADRILHGGRVYTLNSLAPWAEAVAIRGDEIVYVGDDAGAERFAGADTQRTDLRGRLALPGFIDGHMHVGATLPYVFAAGLSPDMSAEQLLAAIREHAQAYPDQDPLIGTGFLGAAFGLQGPTAEDLDRAVPERRAIIYDEGFHSAWVNSAAMQQVGLDADSQDPIPGAHYYKRYADGRPTGWLIESESFGWISEKLGVVSMASLEAGAQAFFGELTARGITAAFDAGMIEGDGKLFDFFERMVAEDRVPLRMVGSHYVNSPRQLPTALEDLAALNKRFDGEFFDLRVLKLSLDGTVEAQTAYTLEPYRVPAGHRANPLIPIGPTGEVVAAASARDIDIHMHAIGDAAVRMALDMVEQARRQHPKTDSRFTICHAQVVNPQDIARFGELDVIVQSTPTWYAYDELALNYLGAERLEHFYPLRSIAAGGARVTLGSDFPASWIGLDGLDPLYNIEMAMTRQPAGDADYAPQPPLDERISVEQAIRAYTLDAAYQLRLEDEIGSIEPGKQADLVVLDQNILELDPYAIHDASVVMTMIDGRIVFESP
ncbi:MAG: putative amidohydrolase YtcJ [Halieaceae bacterium]|jgi:predicted amidohydrolase YtcJ